ncbi:glycosyltransferase family 4 protein [Vibrio cyclitrophicus]
MSERKKLIFFGELPPTVLHGVSLSNARILSSIVDLYDIKVVEDKVSFKSRIKGLLGFSISLFKLAFFSFQQCDVYYTNLPTSFLGLVRVYFTVLLVKFLSFKVKVYCHLHRGDINEFLLIERNRKVFESFSKRLYKIIVLADSCKVDLEESGFIESEKIFVLHNTVSVETVESNFSSDYNYFYCLCNYIETKRIDKLVSISNKLGHIDFRFNGAVSSNSYYVSMKSKSGSNCEIGSTIQGQEKELALRNAKALVLPSLNEGMPLVILESLALGTPVICFNIGFISDYIGEDYPGLVTDLSDKALTDKITWLNELSSSDYMNLRTLSYKLFWDNFSEELILKDVYKCFGYKNRM